MTLDDVVADVAIREFADRTDLYGEVGTFDHPQRVDPEDAASLSVWKNQILEWNPAYKPWFYRDIWTILDRPDQFSYLSNILGQSNFPHNASTRGTFDPVKLGTPPVIDRRTLETCFADCRNKDLDGGLIIGEDQAAPAPDRPGAEREVER